MKDILRIGNKPIIIENNILQLTDSPNLVTTGDGDKYIGYEHIGGAYSGNRKYVIGERDGIVASYISDIVGTGVFLDLGIIQSPHELNWKRGTKRPLLGRAEFHEGSVVLS